MMTNLALLREPESDKRADPAGERLLARSVFPYSVKASKEESFNAMDVYIVGATHFFCKSFSREC